MSAKAGLPQSLLVLLVAVLVRLPTLALPLDAEGATLATRGARMGQEVAFHLEEATPRGPLLPVLLAVPTAAGSTPTAALRTLDVLLAGLFALLVLQLATRAGLGPGSARLGALLVAVHPLLLVHVGGPRAGTAGLVSALFAASLLGVFSSGARRRRLGALLALLLPWADPMAALLALPVLAAYLLREASRRLRAVTLGLVVLVLLFTPLPALDGEAGLGARLLGLVLLWVPGAALLALLVRLGPGLRQVGRSSLGRTALAGAAATTAVASLLPVGGGPALDLQAGRVLAPLVPWVVLAGVLGWRALAPGPWRRGLARAAAGVAVVGALLTVLGPVQVWLRPEAPGAAGRLHRLGRAVRAAADAAGEDGWVAVDLDHDLGALEIERLSDLTGGRPTGRLPKHGPEEHASSVLSLEDLPPGATLAVLTRYRPEVLEVVTLGGSGIWTQRPVARFGPWLVLAAKRP